MTEPHFATTNPSTGKEESRFPFAELHSIDAAIELCHKTHLTWRAQTMTDRAQVLGRMAQLLDERIEDYATLMAIEMGKPLFEGRAEITKCAKSLRAIGLMAPQILHDDVRPSDAKKSFVRHEPLGVILAVMPWNFPFWQLLRMAGSAWMAGNTIILKHARSAPQCALALEQLALDASGVPGLLRNVFAKTSHAEHILAHPHVRALTLTGSAGAGRALAALAGQYLKPCVLELGGSDPFIVCQDVDVNEVAAIATRARCQNSGQSCVAAKRFIVHESIYDAFASAMTARMQNLVVGDPMDSATQVGPLAHEGQLIAVKSQVDDAVRHGAKVLCGGNAINAPGYFFEPTVLAHVTPKARVYLEEIFAPVACLYKFSNDDEAIQLANATDFGLGASVWTLDVTRALHFVRNIESGNVFVNAMVKSDPAVPFGGVKDSGFGRELGREGLLAFVSAKTVWLE